MTRKTALTIAAACAVLHLVLACIYANITPYRSPGILLGQRDPSTGAPQRVPDVGAPDERQHVNYVIHLLDGKGFPVLDPQDPNLGENYQAHQPPLFYILHIGWSKITGADLNDPGQGLKVRFPNALIGAATVMGAFFLGLWAFRREDVGLVAASFVALLPMNVALSGAISNDPLLYCLCTWVLAFIAKGCQEGWSTKVVVAVGIGTGLAVITKTTAVGLLPILLLALFLGPNKPAPKQIAIATITLLLVCTPWLARNQSLYGDPLAISAFNKAFVNSPSRELMTQVAEAQGGGKSGNQAYWVDWVGWWTARSFFGVFGYMDIFLNEQGVPFTSPRNPNAFYRVLLAIGVLITAGWAIALRKVEWSEQKRMHILLSAFLLIVGVLFLRFNAQYFQGQARYLFPAIGVIGIGVAISLLNVAKNRLAVAMGLVVLLLGGLNIYVLSKLPGEFERRTLMVSNTHGPKSNVQVSNDATIGRV